MPAHPRMTRDEQGFTLIEIAIVMVIIGLLTGGGVSLMRMLTERKARNETVTYLVQTRTALISFAENFGRLPWADTDGDGNENSGAGNGTLPYLTLQLAPADTYKRSLRYGLNTNLGTSRTAGCAALRSGLGGAPQVVDADGAPAAFPTALVLVSAGPMDADSNGNVFDDLTTGTHQGDNTDGTPNYLRHPPVDAFDDLTVYVSGNELYGHMCEYVSVAVNNNTAANAYVYDVNQGLDLGNLPAGGAGVYNVLSGSRLELRSGAGGGGLLLASTPPTPIVLAGRGMTLTLP